MINVIKVLLKFHFIFRRICQLLICVYRLLKTLFNFNLKENRFRLIKIKSPSVEDSNCHKITRFKTCFPQNGLFDVTHSHSATGSFCPKSDVTSERSDRIRRGLGTLSGIIGTLSLFDTPHPYSRFQKPCTFSTRTDQTTDRGAPQKKGLAILK